MSTKPTRLNPTAWPRTVLRELGLAMLVALLVFGALLALGGRANAQESDEAEPLTPAELEDLVGPIALYPDDLLAIVLPASTYPLQIVQAARFLEERNANESLEPSENWDDSVIALLNYPEALQLLNDDLDWTWALGAAVLDDQPAVLDAVQTFRERAYTAGNLRSDDLQTVTRENNVIVIAPADPKIVYVPYYEPSRVVVYQPVRPYYYHPWGYPLYYYPYPVGYSFGTGFFFGVTTAFTIGWQSHFLHMHHHTHYGHPYYGYDYYPYGPYYWRTGININYNYYDYDYVWHPAPHGYGSRPNYHNDARRVRTAYEGYARPAANRSYGAAPAQSGRAVRDSEGSAGTGRSVTGTGRSVAGTGRSVTGTGRSVAGTGSSVTGTGRSVAGTGRSVTGTERSVGGVAREPGRTDYTQRSSPPASTRTAEGPREPSRAPTREATRGPTREPTRTPTFENRVTRPANNAVTRGVETPRAANAGREARGANVGNEGRAADAGRAARTNGGDAPRAEAGRSAPATRSGSSFAGSPRNEQSAARGSGSTRR